MALTPLPGTATTTVKVGELNAIIAALNAELAVLERQTAVVLPDSLHSLADTINSLAARTVTLESEPDPVIPPDLTDRVAALEHLVVRAPAQDPTPTVLAERPPRPAGLTPDRIHTVYDQVALYYGDMAIYADRVGDRRWHLYAQLNYIVISPAMWTYDEVFEGTPDQAYAHAVKRLEELARLKPIHDAVHDRVRRMSEGQL